jgi:hypothetical protein
MTRTPKDFYSAVILLFAGVFTGFGLWGTLQAARYLLMLCGVQFDSM